MQPALERIKAVSGVLGAFIPGDGRYCGSSMPAFFGSDALNQVGGPLIRALETARGLSVHVQEASLSFGEARLVVIPLARELLLAVLCKAGTDQQILSEVLSGVGAECTALVSGAQEPDSVGQTLEQLAAPGILTSPEETAAEVPGTLSGTAFLDADSSLARAPDNDPAISSGSSPAPGRAGVTALEAVTAAPPTATASVTPAEPVPIGPRPGIGADLATRLRLELALHVGPVAALLVAEAVRSCSTPKAIVDYLANEIDVDSDRRSFLAAVDPLVR